MATLKDISAKVGRSVTTVSRALANCSDVSPETIRIVHEVAKELRYEPNIQARRLQKQSSDTIGIVTPVSSKGYAEPFFCEFLAGVGEAAAESGYDLMVTYAKHEDEELEIYKKLVQCRKVDGFILYRTLQVDARVDYCKRIGIPFAVFGQVENHKDYSFIDVNGYSAMENLAEYLVSLGHKRIGCLCSNMQLTSAKRRFQGLCDGLAKNSIILSEENFIEGCYDQKDGYEKARILFSKPDRPTALVCFSDLVAFGAINAAKDLGLHVGADVSITGFDDIQMAEFYRPPLTTVRQPIQKIGYQVTQFLLEKLLSKEGIECNKQIVLDPELIVRSSSGMLKSN